MSGSFIITDDATEEIKSILSKASFYKAPDGTPSYSLCTDIFNLTVSYMCE